MHKRLNAQMLQITGYEEMKNKSIVDRQKNYKIRFHWLNAPFHKTKHKIIENPRTSIIEMKNSSQSISNLRKGKQEETHTFSLTVEEESPSSQEMQRNRECHSHEQTRRKKNPKQGKGVFGSYRERKQQQCFVQKDLPSETESLYIFSFCFLSRERERELPNQTVHTH